MEEVQDLRRRRLIELEKRAAREGSQCDPAVLIELAELRKIVAPRRKAQGRSLQLDIELLTACMANALQRITLIEQAMQRDQEERHIRQRWADILQASMLVLMCINLFMAIAGR